MQSKPKMSFVMPAFKSAATIRKAIESIYDQDYKNWELIIVLDGKDEAIDKILDELINTPFLWDKERAKTQVVTIKHQGACAARNAGAELATGDYISFFSSDFIAEPGMLRMWMQAFEETGADFVYGGYKFWDRPGKALYSAPFDLYALTCAPYIDGGFPVKMSVSREHPWDEKCKSLQDWDWTLRIALSGAKFAYIPDFTYSAQAPIAGGLSEDSDANWQKREGYIKKKLGIPQRDICVCSVMYQDEAKRLAQSIGADYKPMPSFKPHKYKLIYQIGFDFEHGKECAAMFLDAPKAKKVIHWMPMDIRQMKTRANIASIEMLAQAMTKHGYMNYACTAEDVKFLTQFGFKAKLGFYFAYPAHGSRENTTTTAWLQPGLEEIKKGMPDIEITENRRLSNLDVLIDRPWGDVAESLLAGKSVISNIPYPGVTLINTLPTFPEMRAEIINAIRRGKYQSPNGIHKMCNERKFRREMEALCRK
jgi:glycosyltransferase involved in cell wall biosynthesis